MYLSVCISQLTFALFNKTSPVTLVKIPISLLNRAFAIHFTFFQVSPVDTPHRSFKYAISVHFSIEKLACVFKSICDNLKSGTMLFVISPFTFIEPAVGGDTTAEAVPFTLIVQLAVVLITVRINFLVGINPKLYIA